MVELLPCVRICWGRPCYYSPSLSIVSQSSWNQLAPPNPKNVANSLPLASPWSSARTQGSWKLQLCLSWVLSTPPQTGTAWSCMVVSLFQPLHALALPGLNVLNVPKVLHWKYFIQVRHPELPVHFLHGHVQHPTVQASSDSYCMICSTGIQRWETVAPCKWWRISWILVHR